MARLVVRLTPRGGRDAVDGWMRDGAGRAVLKARVAAPPADGAANAALIRLIAKALATSADKVRIVAGASARVKQIEVDGLDEGELARAFGTPPKAD